MAAAIPPKITKWFDVGVSIAAAVVIYGALQKILHTEIGSYSFHSQTNNSKLLASLLSDRMNLSVSQSRGLVFPRINFLYRFSSS